MSHFQIGFLIVSLVLLILLSAFFNVAETSLISLNRYRLRHQARLKKSYALLILKLLKRPDRLLGLILIGNNVANIVASVIATILTIYFFGEESVVITTIILTIVILIFAEICPKTIAALYPEEIGKKIAYPVKLILVLFYPLVWFVNVLANGVLRIFRFKVKNRVMEPISREELRSFVYDTSGRISQRHQDMLLGILDLNKILIDNVMIPRHEINGIDLNAPWDTIRKKITTSAHEWIPVYREDINQIAGLLHLREVLEVLLNGKSFDMNRLLHMLQEPYFVPKGTALNTQLINFQQQHKRIALVVDEYGEVEGLLTLEDILEEIVGEFAIKLNYNKKLALQGDGSYRVDGAITLREFNKLTGWKLPRRGARTLSGLIIEYLEAMPQAGLCVKISGYPIEIMEVKNNRVKTVKLFPKM